MKISILYINTFKIKIIYFYIYLYFYNYQNISFNAIQIIPVIII